MRREGTAPEAYGIMEDMPTRMAYQQLNVLAGMAGKVQSVIEHNRKVFERRVLAADKAEMSRAFKVGPLIHPLNKFGAFKLEPAETPPPPFCGSATGMAGSKIRDNMQAAAIGPSCCTPIPRYPIQVLPGMERQVQPCGQVPGDEAQGAGHQPTRPDTPCVPRMEGIDPGALVEGSARDARQRR